MEKRARHIQITELETDLGIPEEFHLVMEYARNRITGSVKITRNAIRATIYNGFLYRRHAAMSYYFITNVAGKLKKKVEKLT